jgi:hypothetical protein
LIAVSSDGRISANVQDRPLGEMLRLMSEKKLFEIQGSLPIGTLVTMQFSDLTLEQVFNRMMRGYNYAAIKEEVSDKRVLIVLGEARRIEYREPAKPAQALNQSRGAPAQALSNAPDAKAANLSGPARIQQPPAPTNAANPASPLGPSQAAGAPPVPAAEQKGLGQPLAIAPTTRQPDVGAPGPPTGSGAAATAPKTENVPALEEPQPPDRSTLGSF